MSRTDIDAATLASYLRQMCGDGSVEWSYEPMQTSVLLDIADMLDESSKLRELVADMWFWHYEGHIDSESQERQMLHIDGVIHRMRELGIEVDE